jgi:uncharacterized membrane protein YbhN (UPF0104 family)
MRACRAGAGVAGDRVGTVHGHDGSDSSFPTLTAPRVAYRHRRMAFALLLLAAVLGTIVHFSEIRALASIVRNMRPEWLLGAVTLQALTYVCAARVWALALEHEGFRYPVRELIPMALAMLFANQAFPSAGLAGSAVVMRGLQRRHVPPNIVMGALLIGLVTMYAAYLVAVILGLAILGVRAESVTLLVIMGLFAAIAAGIPRLEGANPNLLNINHIAEPRDWN